MRARQNSHRHSVAFDVHDAAVGPCGRVSRSGVLGSLLKPTNAGFQKQTLCGSFAYSTIAYMCAMMLSPNSLHLISVAPSISRAKS
jgi:hypothetical protein